MSRLLVFALLAHTLCAASTTVLFDPSTPETGPFPSDFLTVADLNQYTGLRVNLPVPDCATAYTACQEKGLIDQLDGFSILARARVRFSAAIDTSTLRSGIFYVALDDLTSDEPGLNHVGDRISVNQVVYDPVTNTAYAKPDSVLDQHRRYALVVTDAVKDTAGNAVAADPRYLVCAQAITPYCAEVASALTVAAPLVAPQHIVSASVFTTMSATRWLEGVRPLLDYFPPSPKLTEPRSTFRIQDLSSIVLHEQTGTAPVQFSDLALPISSTLLTGIDRVVIGSYQSPNFLAADQTIPPYPTAPSPAVPPATNKVYFNALLPTAAEPASGYPVVIFGHGFGDSRFGGPTAVAPTLARAGFAVIAINAVGHGYGPLSTVTFVDNSGAATTLTAGGRSRDINGDGTIEANEGCALVTPIAYGTRDCFRQTVVDLMQLVRTIQGGLDLDGDGHADLDPNRIYYAGQSLGAIYGTMLTAVEPAVRAAALNVGGGTTVDIARWSPSYRDLTNETLGLRIPSLLNEGSTYDEDYVLRDQPVKVVTVDGAIAIQNVFETLEWLGMSGDPIAYAPHLKRSPLPGAAARPVLMQFARGDRTVPNPANSALIRAAGLQASTWEYRHDLARAVADDLPVNPHPYLVLFVSLNGSTIQLPGLSGLAVSLDAQQQIAGFLSADGQNIPDANGLVKLVLGTNVFQVPTTLPEDLGF
ncbi:MAG TPA: Ig-like domain-containing protein [Bryobacteraceae bacterium]|nr:Ig-like domain-containing protein [Bryobacteraceae bacterium]